MSSVSIYDEPKIDCHSHVLDPARFPYIPDTAYRPSGQEIATAAQFRAVMTAYDVQYALMVGPTSGYNTDNRYMLDAIVHGQGRLKGIAVVGNTTTRTALTELKRAGTRTPCWIRSAHPRVCGRRIGRSCAPRNGSTMAHC